jgi:hypothetical protein
MASSPTSRTLDALRKRGYTAGVVEKWVKMNPSNPTDRKGFRKDLFGFCDIIAIRTDVGIVAVQCTSYAGHSDHRKKILSIPEAKLWLRCRGRILLISWKKKRRINKYGSKSKIHQYVPKTEEITLDMFD